MIVENNNFCIQSDYNKTNNLISTKYGHFIPNYENKSSQKSHSASVTPVSYRKNSQLNRQKELVMQEKKFQTFFIYRYFIINFSLLI